MWIAVALYRSRARMLSHARMEAATGLQVLLTRLDVLKSLVGHVCGDGKGSRAVRCELVRVEGGGDPMDSAACVRWL